MPVTNASLRLSLHHSMCIILPLQVVRELCGCNRQAFHHTPAPSCIILCLCMMML
jgi:hypothetical protein